jgi:chromosome segregation ATPase
VHGIASDIAKLEAKCNFLEERNLWLTNKLLTAQRKFINRTVMSGGKAKMSACFQCWREAMHELRLEKQLDEQTRSLDQCQNVAKELGSALTHEQQLRAATEAQQRELEAELHRATQLEAQLQAQVKNGQRHIELLDRRVHEAENCLVRSAAEARNVIDTANEYERSWRELENETKFPLQHNLVEHSIQLREEAHGVMQKVTPLLRNRPSSPDGRD